MGTTHVIRRMSWTLLGAAVGLALTACTEKTIYRDFPGFKPPPTGAGNFVGYSDNATKLTVCGNCHADHQAKWEKTKHSEAWANLVASGELTPANQDDCGACHAVSKLGSGGTTDAVGFIGSHDARYYDVQCESCHGAGQDHISNPEVTANQPIASLAVDTNPGTTSTCAACHHGSYEPFVDQWKQSIHGLVPDQSHAASCGPNCHTGQGALAAWGVTAQYKEKNDPNWLPITCGVCHDPHGAAQDANGDPLPFQLRFDVAGGDTSTNLCTRCHARRAGGADQVLQASAGYRGPHAPEGPLVFGDGAGWRPPGMTTDPILGSHGDPSINKRMCATCHVDPQMVQTPTGPFMSAGHLFEAIPCLDQNGVPTPGGNCADDQRTYHACTASGCHGSETVAQSLIASQEIQINGKLAQLKTLLENTAKIPCSEYNSASGAPWTVARGARFNYLLASEAAPSTQVDAVCPGPNRNIPPAVAKKGSAVHNPFLINALLQASIDAVIAEYP